MENQGTQGSCGSQHRSNTGPTLADSRRRGKLGGWLMKRRVTRPRRHVNQRIHGSTAFLAPIPQTCRALIAVVPHFLHGHLVLGSPGAAAGRLELEV